MVRVVFVHPDLGIGGAERLVIDAALALKSKGHSVTFLTSHHDPTHCFPETKDGTLKVICVGDWLPRSTFGYFYALWAYIRMIFIAFYLVLISDINYDILFVDQISACIPILKLRSCLRIIFYCHYPDQLLTDRKVLLKKIYRYFIDSIEEMTTKMADIVLVNSNFTARVFKDTFKSISITPQVLYPSFDVTKYDKISTGSPLEDNTTVTFLSLNRYERKKNVDLALLAFKSLIDMDLPEDCDRSKLSLVIAGGYDNRVNENVEYFSELNELATLLSIQDKVNFLKSPSDDTKLSLLRKAICLLYTPANEHFGIVPIEAMYVGTPVIAVNSGGPTETVVDGLTGFLVEQNPQAFAKAMKKFVNGSLAKSDMTLKCTERVRKHFSFEEFASRLDRLMKDESVSPSS